MEAVLADVRLSSGEKCVAIRLALHRNAETGRCDPSVPRIAVGTGMTPRTVERAISSIEYAGWILRQSTRGRTSNSYLLLLPEEAATPTSVSGSEEANPVVHVGVGNNLNPDEEAGVTPTRASAQPRHRRRTNKEENKEENHQLASRADPTLFPVAVSTEPKPPRPKADRVTRSEFETWFEAYPKPVAEDAAERAYRSVRKKGASRDELLEAAKRFSAERAGEDPRFTPAPAKWLRDGRWKDRPSSPAQQPSRSRGGSWLRDVCFTEGSER